MAEDSGGSGLESALKGRIFGVPAWSAGVVLAALMIAVVVWRNHQKGQQEAAATDNEQTDDGNEDGTYIQGEPDTYPQGPIHDYLKDNPTNPAYPVGLSPQGLPAPVTNAQWSTLTADYLLGKGNDPTLVETALYRYIHGQTLSTAQQAVVRLALQYFGSPPEGVLPPTPTPSTGPVASGIKGLKASAITKTSVWLDWSPSSNVRSYEVFVNGSLKYKPAYSSQSVSGLKKGTKYTLKVVPVSLDDKTRGSSATISVTTKK